MLSSSFTNSSVSLFSSTSPRLYYKLCLVYSELHHILNKVHAKPNYIIYLFQPTWLAFLHVEKAIKHPEYREFYIDEYQRHCIAALHMFNSLNEDADRLSGEVCSEFETWQ